MKVSLVAVLLFLVHAPFFAQSTSEVQISLQEAAPVTVAMSSQRLAKIDDMLQQAVDAQAVPGIVALIARNGKVIFHNAYGMADNRKGKAMEKDAIFRIASQTKAITATAVMQLWEEGKFRLDDPISDYIPAFAEARILDTFNEKDSTYTTKAAKDQITIRHLLTHTSGLGYGFIDQDARFTKIYAKAGIIDAFTDQDISIGDNIKKLAGLPLHHNPGDAYVYAEGLDVLGYLIEVVSGMPFDEFLRKRLFQPLGMEDTWFYLPQEKRDRLVAVQHQVDGKWESFKDSRYNVDYPIMGARRFFSGGAGLSSTAEDYAKFLQMYLNGGTFNGHRILSPTTIRSIMGNQIGNLWADGGKHYGLAFGVINPKGQDLGGEGSTGTFDWGGYFNTQYFADPELQIIGILMKQTQGKVNDPTAWKFRQMVFAAVEE